VDISFIIVQQIGGRLRGSKPGKGSRGLWLLEDVPPGFADALN
jgi:hypothetical protein